MEMDFMLTVGEGEAEQRYFIHRAFIINEKCYFAILNMSNFDIMFGEFLGEFDEDMEKAREDIYRGFMERKPNVTFVDGYMLDELYDMWDEGELF